MLIFEQMMTSDSHQNRTTSNGVVGGPSTTPIPTPTPTAINSNSSNEDALANTIQSLLREVRQSTLSNLAMTLSPMPTPTPMPTSLPVSGRTPGMSLQHHVVPAYQPLSNFSRAPTLPPISPNVVAGVALQSSLSSSSSSTLPLTTLSSTPSSVSSLVKKPSQIVIIDDSDDEVKSIAPSHASSLSSMNGRKRKRQIPNDDNDNDNDEVDLLFTW
jgi:hypothetical protein